MKFVSVFIWPSACCSTALRLYSFVRFCFNFCAVLLFLLAVHRYKHTPVGVLPTMACCPYSNTRFRLAFISRASIQCREKEAMCLNCGHTWNKDPVHLIPLIPTAFEGLQKSLDGVCTRSHLGQRKKSQQAWLLDWKRQPSRVLTVIILFCPRGTHSKGPGLRSPLRQMRLGEKLSNFPKFPTPQDSDSSQAGLCLPCHPQVSSLSSVCAQFV